MQEPENIYRRGAALVGRFMRTHPGPFAAAVTGAVLFAAAAVGVTLAVGRVTDRVITPAFGHGVKGGTVIGGVAVVIGIGLIRGCSIIMRRYFAGMVEARMQQTLRTEVSDKYLRVPMSYYHANPTGELLAHADADVVGTTNAIRPLPFAIGVVALAVIALISLLLVDWTFAVVALLLFPAMVLLNRWYTSQVEAPVTLSQQLLGEVSGVAHESFDGALVVKTLGLEGAESDRFAATAHELRLADLEVGRIRAGFDPILDAIPNLGALVLFVVGGWRIQQGAVTPGDLVQGALLFSILGFPMRVFGYFLEEMPRALSSIDRIDRVHEQPDAVRVLIGDPPQHLPAGPLGFELTDVAYSYDGEPVLFDVSFAVEPGETVALVGSTGSGKSTLVSLLVRVDEPDSGTIAVGGVDVQRVEPEELRAAVALVFQESFLFADTLRSNVSLGLAPESVVDEAADIARVSRFVDTMDHGWDTIVGERGVTLSGGQRQRVALARALARQPRIMILDDATSAVDPTIEAQILAGLRGSQNTTLLVVAHRLSTIRLADRVVYLEHGRIAGVGRHEDLADTEPGYRALVRAYELSGPEVSDGATA